MKYDRIYQTLRKKYSDEEIADSTLIPADLTTDEQQEAQQQMRAFRLESLQNMTEEEQVLSDVMRLKFQMEAYVKANTFSFEKTFGKYLAEYIRVLRKSRREVAEDLSLHYKKLSRIINDREEPNVELSYRLEKHSGSLIKAITWWKLMVKKQEFIISEDDQTRAIEEQKVKNFLKAG